MKTAMLRSALILCVSVGSASVALAQAPAPPVSLTMNNGRVTLKTTNATVRQILDEWARVGGTKVVNGDKINSQPVSLTLIDVPEGQALETVLRSAAGYMVSEKQTPTSSGSRYDRIMLLARSIAVGSSESGNASTNNAYRPPNGGPMPPGGTVESGVAEDDVDPPAPTAPVVNPYAQGVNANNGGNPNGVPGMANQNQAAPNANATPGYTSVYGSQATVNNNATVNGGAGQVANPPETKFDYANPQKYFQQQQQNGGAQPQTMQPYPGVPLTGTAAAPSNTSTNSSTSSGTPGTGAAGSVTTPQVPANTPANFNPYSPNFNPYNLPAGQGVPGQVSTTPQQPSVEPDRAKYANPYVQPAQTNPPQN